jgi:DNA primase
VWAALSTAGLVSLKLPPKAGKLVIAADNDKAGHRAANALATKAFQIGWEVTLSPPESDADWNIVLRAMGR